MNQHHPSNRRAPALAVTLALSLVACGLFQPAAPSSEAQNETLPPAITSSLVTAVVPTAGNTAVSGGAGIAVTFAAGQNQAVAEASFAVLPGVYTTNLGTQKLTLTAMCNGRWRVRNPSVNAAVFTWDVYNAVEKGSGIVPGSSDVFFTTTPGQKTVRVFVGGALHNTKAANMNACSGTPPALPGKLPGTITWIGNTLNFAPAALLASEQTYTVFVGLAAPHVSAFRTTRGLSLSAVEPATFTNATDVVVTVRGTSLSAGTSFFIQSNRLDVVSVTQTEARLRVPAGFLPSVYGLMAANSDGTRTTLYPAITIGAGAPGRVIDEQRRARSFVEGYVINYATDAPIPGARISLNSLEGTLETTTNASGYYLLRGVGMGKQSFRIEKDGFEPVYRLANISAEVEMYTLNVAALEPKVQRTTTIGVAGGTHYATDAGTAGPFLQIPAGALERDTPIQFTQLRDPNTLPELPNPGTFLAFAHLGPTGLVFKKPATLFLPLQPGIAVAVGTPINIFYFDAKRAEWVDDITSGKISNVNGKLFLEYEINHFTWIGGSWFPDVIYGCAKYPDGQPAPGVITNYGVTDNLGTVRSWTQRSDIRRTLTLRAIGRPLAPTTALYEGSFDVVFPCLVVPQPRPVNPDDLEINATPSRPGEDCVRPQSMRFRAQDEAAGRALTLMSRETFEISTSLEIDQKDSLDFSRFRMFINDREYTAKTNIRLTDDRIVFSLSLIEPLVGQARATVRMQLGRKDGTIIERRLVANIVTKIDVPSVTPVLVPDDKVPPGLTTPFLTEDGPRGILALVRQRDLQGDSVRLNVPVRAVDERGELIKINSIESVAFGAELYSTEARFTDGIALVPTVFRLGGTPVSLDSITLVAPEVNAPSGATAQALQRQGCEPVFSPREPRRPVRLPEVPRLSPIEEFTTIPVVAQTLDFGNKLANTEVTVFGVKFKIGDAISFGWNFIPVVGDGTVLAQQIFNGLTGQGVDVFQASFAAAGLALDASGQVVLGAATSGVLAVVKASRGGRGIVADAIEYAFKACLIAAGVTPKSGFITTQSDIDPTKAIKCAEDIGENWFELIDDFANPNALKQFEFDSEFVQQGDGFRARFGNLTDAEKNARAADWIRRYSNAADKPLDTFASPAGLFYPANRVDHVLEHMISAPGGTAFARELTQEAVLGRLDEAYDVIRNQVNDAATSNVFRVPMRSPAIGKNGETFLCLVLGTFNGSANRVVTAYPVTATGSCRGS